MLYQAFTAADFSCCVFVGLSVFSYVFSEWNAAQSGWDHEIDSAIAEYSTNLPSKTPGLILLFNCNLNMFYAKIIQIVPVSR